jgi:hypothetical protein
MCFISTAFSIKTVERSTVDSALHTAISGTIDGDAAGSGDRPILEAAGGGVAGALEMLPVT